MTAQRQLTPTDVDVLQQIARGYTNDQIAVMWELTRGEVDNRIKAVYRKIGVFEMGHKSRAFALAIAASQYHLPPPAELERAIHLVTSGVVDLDDEIDLVILQMIAEGVPKPEMVASIDLSWDEVSRRIADMRLRLGLALHRPYCVATVAIWAGKLTGLSLDHSRPPTDPELDLLYDIVLEIPVEDTAFRLHISRGAAKARLRAMVLRYGVRTEAQVIDLVIGRGWLPPPSADRRWEAQHVLMAIETAKIEMFSPAELETIGLLAQGKTRTEIAREIKSDLTGTSVSGLLGRLYRHLDISSAATLVAVTRWAGNPETTAPRRHKRVRRFTDTELLVMLVEGLTAAQIDERHQTISAQRELGELYRTLGAVDSRNAVAIAARDGLLDGYFATQDIDSVRADMFSNLYLRALQLIARGTPIHKNAGLLGVSNRSFDRFTERDRALGIPQTRAIAFLIRRGEISILGRPVTLPRAEPPAPVPATSATVPAPTDVPATADVTAAPAATDVPAAAASEPAPLPPPSAPLPSTVLTKVKSLAAASRTDKSVMRGQQALTTALGRYIGQNFSPIIAAIRSGELPCPWMNDRLVTQLTKKGLSENAILFLTLIADGVTLDEIRPQFAQSEAIPDDPQGFRKWYMRNACVPLTAEGPRAAAAIALWLGLIE